MSEKQIRTLPELGFTIVASPDDYQVQYDIYNVFSWIEGDTKGVVDKPRWDAPSEGGYYGDTGDLSEAQKFISGHVKWDGCSNWNFDVNDDTMLHACDRDGLERIGEVLTLCWDWTSELCPNWYPQ